MKVSFQFLPARILIAQVLEGITIDNLCWNSRKLPVTVAAGIPECKIIVIMIMRETVTIVMMTRSRFNLFTSLKCSNSNLSSASIFEDINCAPTGSRDGSFNSVRTCKSLGTI